MTNARLELSLQLDAKPAAIQWVDSPAQGKGLILNNEVYASPRGLLLRFDGCGRATRIRMDYVRRKWDWDPRTFKLDMEVTDNVIRFGGYNSDQDALPDGRYKFRLNIADLKVRSNPIKVEIKGDKAASRVLKATEDPQRVMCTGDLASFDNQLARLLGANQPQLDNMSPWEWLVSDNPRERRKACLLNLLAKLRTAPTVNNPLIKYVRSVLFADVDRIYCEIDGALYHRLLELSDSTERNVFFDEGTPHSSTHQKLLHFATTDATSYELHSFRQEGQPSMQVTVARPKDDADPFYADVDLDLGNPLQDVAGFLIHLGEIVMPGKTDHFKLHKKLLRSESAQFVYYDVAK